jgi:RND family efflux transporter MFP subunit
MNGVCRFAVLLAVATLAGCGPSVTPPAPPVPKVLVSLPVDREVREFEDFTGRTDAVSTVDVRARVSGYLQKVLFEDGGYVKKDALLYQIDPRPFEIDKARAEAEVQRLDAKKKYLQIQVDRYTELVKTGAAPQEDLDSYTAQLAETIGARDAAKAQVKQAELNIEFTRITSPIDGRIDRTLITPGNLINADTSLLTTVVTVDPMFVYVNIEEPRMLRVAKMVREGKMRGGTLKEVAVRMGLADDTERKFPLQGTLDITSNTVDPQTGTIQVRAKFPNPYKLPKEPPILVPGMFVRLRIPLDVPQRSVLVSERAIGTDQGQKFVYVIDDANKAVYRPVKLGLIFDGLQSIEEGLSAGERVVVSGIQKVRPGAEVQPEQVDMQTLASSAAATKPAAAPSAVHTTSAEKKP